jgi:hypothetical protein
MIIGSCLIGGSFLAIPPQTQVELAWCALCRQCDIHSTEWIKFGKIVFEVFLTVSFKLSPDFGEADSFERDMKEEVFQHESTEGETEKSHPLSTSLRYHHPVTLRIIGCHQLSWFALLYTCWFT